MIYSNTLKLTALKHDLKIEHFDDDFHQFLIPEVINLIRILKIPERGAVIAIFWQTYGKVNTHVDVMMDESIRT